MRYRFEPAIFASVPLGKRDWRWHLTSAFSQRLRKYTFTAVHTKTHRRRFQMYPLWRAFSNLCVYFERSHGLRVDGRPKCIKKFAFTSVCVYNRLCVDGALNSPLPAASSTCLILNFHVYFLHRRCSVVSLQAINLSRVFLFNRTGDQRCETSHSHLSIWTTQAQN